MPKAKWSTKPNEIASSVEGGTFNINVPLYDDNVKQGDLRFVMTEDRELTVYWEAEPNATGLSGFQAWSKEA